MWTSLEVFICGKKFVFSTVTSLIFSRVFFVRYFAIHYCLLWMQKIENKFSAILKMSKTSC